MAMLPVIRLRGHHLRCLLFYVGKGYSSAFTQNLDEIVGQINRGAFVEIVTGVDDVCLGWKLATAPVCIHAHDCANYSPSHSDKLTLEDAAKALELPPFKPGDRLKLDETTARILRRHFAKRLNRDSCADCQWRKLCVEIAERNFAGVKMLPSAVPQRKTPALTCARAGVEAV